MAEEFPYDSVQFINRLAFAIAHEIGHLIIKSPGKAGWDGGHLITQAAEEALMSDKVLIFSKGLSDVVGNEAEIKEINLKNKASVKEQ